MPYLTWILGSFPKQQQDLMLAFQQDLGAALLQTSKFSCLKSLQVVDQNITIQLKEDISPFSWLP
jgi:hypothetical protein